MKPIGLDWYNMKTILHLCADIGSDSYFYQKDPEYNVILVGKDIGVENFTPPENVHGIIANPVCTEFSRARTDGKARMNKSGIDILHHCQRIIYQAKPKWWVIENPAAGAMSSLLGKPDHIYQPWQYGSPWTKKTALWGNFTIPKPFYNDWEGVPKIEGLYMRKGNRYTGKPGLYQLHKSAINLIPEMQWAKDKIKCDADLRSMCSQGFAKVFYEANK